MAIDLDSRIAVKQYIRKRVYLALPYIAAATGVADDIFRLQDIVVEESEPTDAGHSELQGNLASPRSAPCDKNLRITEQAHIKQRCYAREEFSVIPHRLLPLPWAIGPSDAKRHGGGAIAEPASAWKKRCASQDSIRS